MVRPFRALFITGMLLAQVVHASDNTVVDNSYVSSAHIGLRYSDSTLHQDGIANTGHANTIRLQLGYLCAFTPHLVAYAKGTRVWSLFGQEY